MTHQHRHIASYYQTPGARKLAHLVKKGNKAAISQMAQELSHLIKNLHQEKLVLVPIPSRLGFATETLELSQQLALLCNVNVKDVIRGVNRESLYDLKKSGISVDSRFFKFELIQSIDGLPVLIDTVLDTGLTMNAAAQLFNDKLTVTHSRVM